MYGWHWLALLWYQVKPVARLGGSGTYQELGRLPDDFLPVDIGTQVGAVDA